MKKIYSISVFTKIYIHEHIVLSETAKTYIVQGDFRSKHVKKTSIDCIEQGNIYGSFKMITENMPTSEQIKIVVEKAKQYRINQIEKAKEELSEIENSYAEFI